MAFTQGILDLGLPDSHLIDSQDERSKFRAAVASHVSSISAILIASGLDFSQRAHHYTNSRLEDVLGKLQISCDEFHATQNRNRIEVLAAVAANDEAQLARHEKCELLQITHYEELRTRLSRLELTTTANNNQKQDVLICMNTLMEDNRAYFQLLLEILKIFARCVQIVLVLMSLLTLLQFWFSQFRAINATHAACPYVEIHASPPNKPEISCLSRRYFPGVLH